MPSTWTRKVAALVVAVVTGALLVAGASPAAAASGTLSVSAAKKLAHKLVEKQRRERSLVFAYLGDPKRRSSTRIDFPYRDRSTTDVLCLARIVVVQSGDKRNADIRGAKCHGIPTEILNFEAVTRSLRKAVKAAGPDVRKSLARYEQAVSRCHDVVVPKARRNDVRLLMKAGGQAAFWLPLRSQLDDFDVALHDVHGQDPSMVRGVEAWDRTLVLVDELPPAAAHPCRAVREWADHNFSKDTAPADFDELKVVLHEFPVQQKVLRETAAYLDDQGVVPKVASVFAPPGILAVANPHPKL
jgi:hypothetical protein